MNMEEGEKIGDKYVSTVRSDVFAMQQQGSMRKESCLSKK